MSPLICGVIRDWWQISVQKDGEIDLYIPVFCACHDKTLFLPKPCTNWQVTGQKFCHQHLSISWSNTSQAWSLGSLWCTQTLVPKGVFFPPSLAFESSPNPRGQKAVASNRVFVKEKLPGKFRSIFLLHLCFRLKRHHIDVFKKTILSTFTPSWLSSATNKTNDEHFGDDIINWSIDPLIIIPNSRFRLFGLMINGNHNLKAL